MKPKVIRCPTCGAKRRRSSNANRYYWALLSAISEEVKPISGYYSSEVWHEYFKQKFLGADDIELPNGKVMVVAHSSSDLDTTEFQRYLDQVSAWASERGVYLEDVE